MTREVINELKKYTVGKKNAQKTEISVLALNRLIFALEEQEPKTGHWIHRNSFLLQYRCSECGRESEKYNYCPNCGAKMREVEE